AAPMKGGWPVAGATRRSWSATRSLWRRRVAAGAPRPLRPGKAVFARWPGSGAASAVQAPGWAPARSLECLPEPVVDDDVLDGPFCDAHANSVALQQIAQLVAVDEVDRRDAIAGSLAV